jgi:hypothetical protein
LIFQNISGLRVTRPTPTTQLKTCCQCERRILCDLCLLIWHICKPRARKVVETTGSLIERFLPKSIYVVTARGFELKVALFVLACSINFLW